MFGFKKDGSFSWGKYSRDVTMFDMLMEDDGPSGSGPGMSWGCFKGCLIGVIIFVAVFTTLMVTLSGD